MTAQSFFAALTISLMLAIQLGCKTVHVDATPDGPTARAAKGSDEPVAVIRGGYPTRAYDSLGTVRAKVKLSPYRKNVWPDDRVLKVMKMKARELGADALVDLHVVPVSGGGNYLAPDGAFRKGNSQMWIATAVIWVHAE